MSVKDAKPDGGRFRAILLRWGIAALLGAVLLVVVGLPARRDTARNARIAAELQAGYQGMERWEVDGPEIEQAVASHDAAVERRWRRLFPADKGKDVLFLELARIADASGVSDFFLAEKDTEMGAGVVVQADAPMDDAPPVDDMAMDDAAPSVTLESYRVRSRFQGDLESTARFLAGLENVERALTVREISIREGGPRLIVEMEMELYVDKEA